MGAAELPAPRTESGRLAGLHSSASSAICREDPPQIVRDNAAKLYGFPVKLGRLTHHIVMPRTRIQGTRRSLVHATLIPAFRGI